MTSGEIEKAKMQTTRLRDLSEQRKKRVEIVAKEGIIVKGTFRMKKIPFRKSHSVLPAKLSTLALSHLNLASGELKLVHAAFLWVFSQSPTYLHYHKFQDFTYPVASGLPRAKAGEK